MLCSIGDGPQYWDPGSGWSEGRKPKAAQDVPLRSSVLCLRPTTTTRIHSNAALLPVVDSIAGTAAFLLLQAGSAPNSTMPGQPRA